MSGLKLCTWNVKGIHTPMKRRKVLNYLKKEGVQIALLQETHLNDTEHLKLQQGGFNQVYFSSFTSRSRGVAILTHKNSNFRILDCKKDALGCYVIIKGIISGEEITILNIYNPPGLPTQLLSSAFSEVVNLCSKHTIIGGDLNCHLCPTIDKSPSGTLSLSPHAKFVNAFCEDTDYTDVWRAQHPTDREYTFFSHTKQCFTRIDYFLLPRSLLHSVIYCSIGPIIISDHAAVFLEYKLLHPLTRGRYWKFNPLVLTDEKFTSYFRDEFKFFYSTNSASTNNSSLLWETTKAFSRGIIISYTSTKKRRQAEQIKIIESKLRRAERECGERPSSQKIKEMSALRSALDTLLTMQASNQISFAKQKLYESGNKAGRYLAYLTKKKANSQTIGSVMDDHGKLSFDTLNINSTFKTFYENLYKSEQQPDSLRKMEDFFLSLNLPCLSEERRATLNAPLSKGEILSAIRGLQSGKSPGPDGLSVEFYKEFPDILIEPLLEMFNDSLAKNTLPRSLREANISLILKKGKNPDDCASYRPISLLNVDQKILSKVLALRLEKLLPTLINEDQTGFIKGRNSYNNMRRLLNTIQYFQHYSKSGVVISLDAEKAFDRIEWSYLFHTLNTFGLGTTFINWVKLLYRNPLSAVLTNGLCSPYFNVFRGTRQGCPLSPLLFALAVEPLAEAVRKNSNIGGLKIANKEHKITLYADDILIVMTDPETSIPSLIETINAFSSFSGYKINFTKSEAMPLGILNSKQAPMRSFPFKWSPEGINYLGIHVTPKFEQMYKLNFPPLFDRIQLDLERWNTLPITWMGRIALLKMNVLPRLLYPLQMVPVVLSHKVLKQLNSWFSSFIWSKRKARLKIATLCRPSCEGGLDFPDIRNYYLSTHLRVIADWVHNKPKTLWIDIESSMSKCPLTTLLFLRKNRSLKLACTNPITVTTATAWRMLRKLERRSNTTSVLTPIWNNPEFIPGMKDNRFKNWTHKGLFRLQDFFEGPTLMSFNQLIEKYCIPRSDFYQYLQVRDFIRRGSADLTLQDISDIERHIFITKSNSSIRIFYNIIRTHSTVDTLHLKALWERELTCAITDDEWKDIWVNVKTLCVCNRVKATQLMILHRAHISPQLRHKFKSDSSPSCLKCKVETGTLTHCFWSCSKVQHFWHNVGQEMDKIFSAKLNCNPVFLLLGLTDPIVTNKFHKKLYQMLTFCARKCLLVNWISDQIPTMTQWHRMILGYISLDYLTCRLHHKDVVFENTWKPFLSYMGLEISSIVKRAFIC